MNTTTAEVGELDSFLNEYPLEKFHPIAYYDKHLDCIRVVIRDCSVTERRINETVTLLEDNYPEKPFQDKYVGFTLKGVRHLFKEAGLELVGVQKITDILNVLVKALPNAMVDQVAEQYKWMLHNLEMEIDFADAA